MNVKSVHVDYPAVGLLPTSEEPQSGSSHTSLWSLEPGKASKQPIHA
jgi:hypothetical protein